MRATIPTQELLELLDILIKTADDPDGVNLDGLEESWPNERIVECLGVVKEIVAESGVLVGN